MSATKKIWFLVFSFSFWFQFIQRIEHLTRKHFFKRGKKFSCPPYSKCITKSKCQQQKICVFSFSLSNEQNKKQFNVHNLYKFGLSRKKHGLVVYYFSCTGNGNAESCFGKLVKSQFKNKMRRIYYLAGFSYLEPLWACVCKF